jgi:hypothetical protein
MYCESFPFMWPCIMTNFLIIKPTRRTNFSNSFWNETLHVSDSYAVYKPVWHIPLQSVQWVTADDGKRNRPKHVEFHFQNKIWEISVSSWFYYKEILWNVLVQYYKSINHKTALRLSFIVINHKIVITTGHMHSITQSIHSTTTATATAASVKCKSATQDINNKAQTMLPNKWWCKSS